MDGSVEKNQIKVARGKIFTLPPSMSPGHSYIVIDANDAGAKIRDTKSGQDYSILKIDPNEWNEVPQSAQTSQPAGNSH